MTIKLLLSGLLAIVIVYAWLSITRIRLVSLAFGAIAIAGLYFVWFPEQSTTFAHLLGVGRGADLVIYLWMVLSLFAILNIHLHLRAQSEAVTTVTQRLALLEAELEEQTEPEARPPADG